MHTGEQPAEPEVSAVEEEEATVQRALDLMVAPEVRVAAEEAAPSACLQVLEASGVHKDLLTQNRLYRHLHTGQPSVGT